MYTDILNFIQKKYNNGKENKANSSTLTIFLKIHRDLPVSVAAQNVLDFMQSLGKFDKIVCWRPPPPEDQRPLLKGILNLSLSV